MLTPTDACARSHRAAPRAQAAERLSAAGQELAAAEMVATAMETAAAKEKRVRCPNSLPRGALLPELPRRIRC